MKGGKKSMLRVLLEVALFFLIVGLVWSMTKEINKFTKKEK
jgi:hypothetical protein